MVYQKTIDVAQSIRDADQHEGNSLVWVNILAGASGHNNFVDYKKSASYNVLLNNLTNRLDDPTYY